LAVYQKKVSKKEIFQKKKRKGKSKKRKESKKRKKIQPGEGIVRFGGRPEPSRVVSLLWVAKHRAQERPRTP
jgi:hypothetical protein